MVGWKGGRLGLCMAFAGPLLAAGCSSTGTERAGDVSCGLQAVKAELAEIAGQVNRMVASAQGFETVAATGNLKAHFASFDESVRIVESQSVRIRVRADDLRARRDAYLEAWEREMATSGNAGVQASSAARREAIATAFGEVEQVARGVRASFDLLMNDVNTIRLALSNDLTPAGVAAVADDIQKAALDGGNVRKGIDAIVASMDRASRELPAQ